MNKIIKYFSLLFIITATISFSSCSDWLNINSNDLKATENSNLDPGYLFNYAAVVHSSNRQAGDFYIPILISGQSVADGGSGTQYGGGWDEARYIISTYSTGNTWVSLYSSSAMNVIKSQSFAEKKGNKNAIAQGNIFLAQIFYELTLIWGDVPCSEALNIDETNVPKIDSQKDVLEQCLALLDDAISNIDVASGADRISDYDIYYKGDMSKWLALAKSLKLRVLMVLVDKDPSKAQDIATLVNAGGFIEDGDDWQLPFYSTSGTENPNYRLNNAYADPGSYYMFFAHNSVLSRMAPLDDPRIPIYFLPGVDGIYRGLDTYEDVELKKTTVGDKEVYQYLSSPVNYESIWSATAPDQIFTYSELSFLLAEVYARGMGTLGKDMAKAQEYYIKGIESSCKYWGISSADITSFTNSLPSIETMGESDALDQINGQSWIALMTRPFEGWVNQRRTNIPILTVPSESITTGLIYRWDYPTRESSVNPNLPQTSPTTDTKLWFQK